MHEHHLIRIQDFNGDHHVRWCLDCGLIMEVFGNTFTEIVPEFAKERLLKEDRKTEKYTYVSDKKIKFSKKRLGKSLNELAVQTPAFNPFKKLPKKGNTDGES